MMAGATSFAILDVQSADYAVPSNCKNSRSDILHATEFNNPMNYSIPDIAILLK